MQIILDKTSRLCLNYLQIKFDDLQMMISETCLMKALVTRCVRSDGDGAVKAFCDVAIENVLLIKGVRVVVGKHGPFVSMPRQLSRNGKWYDSVVPLTKELRTQLQQAVLEAFQLVDSDVVLPQHVLHRENDGRL